MNIHAIETYLDYVPGGASYELLVASLKRLLGQQLRKSRPGELRPSENLLEIVGRDDLSGSFEVRFRGIIKEYIRDYVKIDMTMRKSLTPRGKILHRYLLARGFPNTDIPVVFEGKELLQLLDSKEKWGKTINSLCQPRGSNDKKVSVFDIFKNFKFISDFKIHTSSQRSIPNKLVIFPPDQ